MQESIRESDIPDALPPDPETRLEFLQRPRAEISQHVPLDVGPHQLDRVQLWGIRREVAQGQPGFTRDEGRDGLRLVDASIVQHYHDLSRDVRQHVLEEANDIRALERAMLRVLQELAGTGDCADGRDLIPTGLVEDHGRLAAQRPGVPDGTFQAEAHLIQEDQGRPCGYFFLISGKVV